MPRSRHRFRSRRRRRKAILATASAVSVVLLFGAVYFMSTGGPRRVTREQVENLQVDPAEVVQLRQDVAQLVERFAERESETLNQPTTEDLALLREAVDLQEQLVDRQAAGMYTEDSQRLDRLRARYEAYVTDPLADASRRAEAQGRAAVREGDVAAAHESYNRALEFQQQINTDFPAAKQASAAREAALQRQIEDLDAVPLSLEAQRHMVDGQRLAAQDQLQEARREFLAAQDLLEELSRRFPDSYDLRIARGERIAHAVREIDARLLAHEVDAAKDTASQLAGQGSVDAAAEAIARALELQRRINQDFQGTSVANPARIEALEALRQTYLSAPLATELRTHLEGAGRALREMKQMEAASRITDAALALEALQQSFPRSSYIDEETQLRVRFLNQVRPGLPDLQQAVIQHLRPLPGIAGWSLLDREVSQVLYTRIMGNNPSGHMGDALPVEGVTLAEAQEFAQRLSWVLARDVRLPDEAAFRAAALPVDAQHVRTGSWNSVTTQDRQTQPVGSSEPNARGFYDLLGNVSEWLAPATADAPQATVVGGTVRDNPLRLSEVPQESRSAQERMHYTGFRVMVDMSDNTAK